MSSCSSNLLVVEEPSFQITTSLRWTRSSDCLSESGDIQAASEEDELLLPLHRDRLLASAQTFEWHDAANVLKGSAGLDVIRSKINQHFESENGIPAGMVRLYKVRLVISKSGSLSVDSTAIGDVSRDAFATTRFIPQRSFAEAESACGSPAIVYIDSQPIDASQFTIHKTTYRPHYDDARERVNISHDLPTKAEVLLWNNDGMVMESSLCTPYFLREGRWITPSLICGGNAGVTRRKALEIGVCEEADIPVNSLANGEEIWLSNAVRGFFRGKIYL